MVYLPLSYNGTPQQSEQSPGRFIAVFPQLRSVRMPKGVALPFLVQQRHLAKAKLVRCHIRFAVMNATEHTTRPIVKEVEVRYERPLFDDGFYYHHRVIVPR